MARGYANECLSGLDARAAREHGERRQLAAEEMRRRFKPVIDNLAEGAMAGRTPGERAEVLGREAAGKIEESIADRAALAVVESMTAFRDLELEGESLSAAKVVQLAIEDRLQPVREELVRRGHAARRIDAHGLSGLCNLLGFTTNQTSVIARVVNHVRRFDPAIQTHIVDLLEAGASLSRLDEARRLVPVDSDFESAKRLLIDLLNTPSRVLKQSAQLLIGSARAGELEGEKRAREKRKREERKAADDAPLPDEQRSLLPRTYMERMRESDPALARQIDEAMKMKRGRVALTLSTSVSTFTSLRAVLNERGLSVELPGAGAALRTAFDDADALHSMLADFMTVLHPMHQSRAHNGLPRGLQARGRDAVVRTYCPDCMEGASDEIAAIVRKLEASGRLYCGEIPEEVRQIVFARCGGICEVPGCTRPVDDLHHLHPRRFTTNHHPELIVGGCKFHHLQCIESNEGTAGHLRITGTAPHDLVFTFPDGRVVRSCDAPPTPWQVVRELRTAGATAGLFESSVVSLALGDQGRKLRPATRRREDPEPEKPVPIVPQSPQVLGIVAGVWRQQLGVAGYAVAASKLGSLGAGATAGRDASAGAGDGAGASAGVGAGASANAGRGHRELAFSSMRDLAEELHNMPGSTFSERRKIGEAHAKYPLSWEVLLSSRHRWRHMLAIARRDVGREHDALLAKLMPYLTIGAFEAVLDQLAGGKKDPAVAWSLVIREETRDLLMQAALEVRRAHGCKMTLEEVLEFILRATALGYWPAIPGRPYDEKSPLAAPSMARRASAPNFATATLECARCNFVWQRSFNGEIRIPSPERLQELMATAGAPGKPRVRMIPRSLDPTPRHGRQFQPNPKTEFKALARDGGCRVPGCPHGSAARARSDGATTAGARAAGSTTTGASAAGATAAGAPLTGRPQALRALAVLMLVGRLERDCDLRNLKAGDLVTLCPDHLRAILTGGIKVDLTRSGLASDAGDEDIHERIRFRPAYERSLGRRTREWLKKQRRQRIAVDLEDLAQRIARLEGRPPPR